MTAVIRDPNHPDFPHATKLGAARRCKCDRCRPIALKLMKHRRIMRERHVALNGAGAVRNRTPAAVRAKTYEHITVLASIPGASYAAIGRAAGLQDSAVGIFMNRYSRGRSMHPDSAAAVLNVTPDSLRPHLAFIARSEAVHVVRQLQALGYPIAWQENQPGCKGVRHFMASKPQTVSTSVYVALVALRDRLTYSPAQPVEGELVQRAITRAKMEARKHGVHPPSYYDEAGNLDVTAIPGHPAAVANDYADEALHNALSYLKALETGGIRTAAQVLVKDGPEQIRNLREASIRRDMERFVDRHQLKPGDEGYKTRRRYMAQVLNDYSHGGVGSPVAVALALGIWRMDMAAYPEGPKVRSLLLPVSVRKDGSVRKRVVASPTEPHPGVAEADELAHLHPLVVVPMATVQDDDQSGAA